MTLVETCDALNLSYMYTIKLLTQETNRIKLKTELTIVP